MNSETQKKLVRARGIALKHQRQQEKWHEQYETRRHNSALEARFKEATPSQIIDMYERGVNEVGQALSPFEFEALCRGLVRCVR